jgi:hypothetical protein
MRSTSQMMLSRRNACVAVLRDRVLGLARLGVHMLCAYVHTCVFML